MIFSRITPSLEQFPTLVELTLPSESQNLSLSDLIAQTTERYIDYLNTLGELVRAVEGVQNKEGAISALEKPDYADRLWEKFNNKWEGGDKLSRIRALNPEIEIASSTDLPDIRVGVVKAIEKESDSGRKSRLEELFEVISLSERTVSFSTIGAEVELKKPIPLPVAQEAAEEPLRPLTGDESQLMVECMEAFSQEEKAEIEQKVAELQPSIESLKRSRKELIDSIEPQKGDVLLKKGELLHYLRPLEKTLIEAFEEQAGISLIEYPNWAPVYLEWKKTLSTEIDLDLKIKRSGNYEDKIGRQSWGNHFDIFLLDPEAEPTFVTHWHKSLHVIDLLALSNPVTDIGVYMGSVKAINKLRKTSGPGFFIPRGGVLEYPGLSIF